MQRGLTFILAILVLLLLPQATGLVPGLWPRASPTMLTLVEQARVTRPLDDVRVQMRIRTQGADSSTAESLLNSAMTSGVSRAGAVSGLRVTTGALWIGRVAGGDTWQAERLLTLGSENAGQLADIATMLEQNGLIMEAVVWRLTPQTEAAARLQAEALAMTAARARIEALATRLGMRIDQLTDVRVQAETQGQHQSVQSPFAPGARVGADSIEAEVTVTLHVQVALRPLP